MKKRAQQYSKGEIKNMEIMEKIHEKILEVLGDQEAAKESIAMRSSGDSPFSQGSQFGSNEQVIANRVSEINRCGSLLPYLHLAILKIETGRFGVCEYGSSDPKMKHLIPKERLSAIPWARTCISCKNKGTSNVGTAIYALSRGKILKNEDGIWLCSTG